MQSSSFSKAKVGNCQIGTNGLMTKGVTAVDRTSVLGLIMLDLT